jgi:exopolyphosphatase/guanosine-5'-triphosphate,3'-diphosphate pyrophosphatase
MKRLIVLAVALLSTVFAACAEDGGQCNKVMHGIDIGSGSMRVSVNLVDSCRKQLVEKRDFFVKHLSYQKCLDASPDETLSPKCLVRTAELLQELHDQGRLNCNHDNCVAIATAWARQARNIDKVKQVYAQQNIKLKVLSQDEEGRLAYKTLRSYLNHNAKEHDYNPDEQMLVIDVGGGSYQLSTQDHSDNNGGIYVYDGEYGVINFSDHLANKFTKKSLFYSKKDLAKVMSYAVQLIGSHVTADSMVHSNAARRVYGVGRVFNNSIQDELGINTPITKERLMDMIYKLSSIKNDAQMLRSYPKSEGAFLAYAQDTLILVYAIMVASGIGEVEIISKAEVTDYISVHPDLETFVK